MRNVALIGYRGTGKTSVAKRLAARLGWQWVDADEALERSAGTTIREIFDHQGETAFRDLEARILRELLERKNVVIATGGGVILRTENRAALSDALVVWLTASIDTICERIGADPSTGSRRPKLTVGGGRAEIEQLLAAREPLYRQCANQIIDTEGRSPDDIAHEIATLPELRSSERGGQ